MTVVYSPIKVRVKFRGFSENKNSDGFKSVTKYLKDNIDELAEECQ